MIDTYNQAGYVRNMETYGLRNMIRHSVSWNFSILRKRTKD